MYYSNVTWGAVLFDGSNEGLVQFTWDDAMLVSVAVEKSTFVNVNHQHLTATSSMSLQQHHEHLNAPVNMYFSMISPSFDWTYLQQFSTRSLSVLSENAVRGMT